MGAPAPGLESDIREIEQRATEVAGMEPLTEEAAAEEPAEEEEAEPLTPTATETGEAAPTAAPTNAPTSPPAMVEATATEQPVTPTQAAVEEQPPQTQTVIEVEWPVQMEINRADSVRIALIRISEGVYVPTVEVGGNVVEAATPIPVGTPGAPIEEAFGSSYYAYATASLVGTTFDIKRASLERRSLAQDRIVWEWNLTPTAKGPQALNANIVIEWEPDDGGATIERQIWQARLDTEVKKRFLPTQNVGLVTAISGVIGSGFSIPWIFDRLQDFVFGRIQDWLYDRAKAGVQRRSERRRKKKQARRKK
jgi:hypothetical protein